MESHFLYNGLLDVAPEVFVANDFGPCFETVTLSIIAPRYESKIIVDSSEVVNSMNCFTDVGTLGAP